MSASSKKVVTVYMHMDRIDVKAGQKVSKGQQIGTAGNTGNSGGAHLHYAIRFDGVNVDLENLTVKDKESLTNFVKLLREAGARLTTIFSV